jgi:hypothetical protein
MEINEIYAQYCRFWELFQTCPKYRNRRACSFGQWKARSQAAREVMIQALERDGPPKEANPYFWIQDFDEPEPFNWNGHALDPKKRYVTAKWKDKWGTYAVEDVERFNLKRHEDERKQ